MNVISFSFRQNFMDQWQAHLRINLVLSFLRIQKTISILQISRMNRPMALVCYICGREFGTKSLAIHLKACEKKWENEQNLKPPKQRRPCPQAPKGFQQLITKQSITKNDINMFNSQSFNTFVEDALVSCEYCGRKFNPKSLVPHQKACKTNPMIRKPYVSKEQAKFQEQQQEIKPLGKGYSIPDKASTFQINQHLAPCRKCGRKFAVDRVSKHQKVCKGQEVKTFKGISEKYQPKIEQKIVSKHKPVLGEKKAKWKVQHEQLQNAMKAMRQMKQYEAKGGKISDLPPPPKSNYDHYVECQYCGRKYAAEVAERHIPKCANIINKPGGIKASTIQQKYIQGTGAGMSKGIGSSNNYPVTTSIPYKPAMKTTTTKTTNTKTPASSIVASSSKTNNKKMW